MSDDLSERLTDLLDAAEAALESDDDEALLETAEEASSVLEDGPTEEVLSALGFETGADGPGSIPEAVLTGERESVSALNALVKLERLAGGEEPSSDARSALDAALEARAPAGTAVDESDDGASDESEESTDEGDEESADEGDEESADEGDGEGAGEGDEGSADDESEDGERRGDTDGDETVTDRVGETLEGITEGVDDESPLADAVSERLGAFGDDLEGLRGTLEGALGDDSSEEPGGEGETDDEDDPLFDSFGSSESAKGTMYSTVAPPPSERADMRTSTRHSTMPDRK
ncbi:DNA polymerase V family protein [Natronobiforma cellulositropha]|uniref:DNA polymerase V family protein n=1 Tax=Natronobiforma cellulositropha TaxID=1679076 RepID=UPI0021D56D97|nr:DNA polymerase V family protein [Natronobiforma cellulositropha]